MTGGTWVSYCTRISTGLKVQLCYSFITTNSVSERYAMALACRPKLCRQRGRCPRCSTQGRADPAEASAVSSSLSWSSNFVCARTLRTQIVGAGPPPQPLVSWPCYQFVVRRCPVGERCGDNVTKEDMT